MMSKSLADKIRAYGRALSADEVQSLIPVNLSTVYKMAKEDRIPSFRFGGRVWFDCYQLAAWYESKAVI